MSKKVKMGTFSIIALSPDFALSVMIETTLAP